jgi:hypothetical protein
MLNMNAVVYLMKIRGCLAEIKSVVNECFMMDHQNVVGISRSNSYTILGTEASRSRRFLRGLLHLPSYEISP